MNLPNRLNTLLFALLTWPVRVAAHRRVLSALARLDDRELADIGLIRQDLRDATALPLTADPSDALAQRARERAEASLQAQAQPTPPPAATGRAAFLRIAAE